ncbi:MAG: hypothetical protein NWT08_08380 [Akkermansiaceae bacterium]|nr:hypothetical protein [Akkermansiaceae bacterium]MDP4647961.1 hypothetical protein [Akkermansiaceae bacterium]MDP4719751.1 hypothetical protein [Akkermansiaceae bacterium]MDP4781306.1 hypothetical protein [Akkermansiaceae bacterium]MDP4846062.1 hypothetical protein [Akkermansiaceae bacterium]
MKSVLSLLICLLLFPAGNLLAGGNKGKSVNISFHIETEGSDNPKMIIPQMIAGKQRFFRRLPEISSKDLAAFTPFPADDQASYGVVFQIKGKAHQRFEAVTTDNRGRWLLCQAFGRAVDAVLIDEPVTDGAIVIWKGITLEEVHELDKAMPRIGE